MLADDLNVENDLGYDDNSYYRMDNLVFPVVGPENLVVYNLDHQDELLEDDGRHFV